MGPKKGGQDKAAAAKRAQAVADKTFGLKNKNKSKKVQQYVQQLQQNSAGTSREDARAKAAAEAAKKAKEAAKEAERVAKMEMEALLRAQIKQPPLPPGTDPMSVLCAFFKQNVCGKGAKCKFSHDRDVERKVAKIDVTVDRRDEEEKAKGSEGWSQEELEDAIRKQEGRDNLNKPTDIVCKYFIAAVEDRTYGWFWVCPNGGKTCKYRHALPPGYVLKRDRLAALAEEAEEAVAIEEEVEEERAGIKGAGTEVTKGALEMWWASKREEDNATAVASGGMRAQGGDRVTASARTGKELFMAGGIFEDDADASANYERDTDAAAEEREAMNSAMRAQAEMEAAMKAMAVDGLDESSIANAAAIDAARREKQRSSQHHEKMDTSKLEASMFGDDDEFPSDDDDNVAT